MPTALDDAGLKSVEESRQASGPTFDRRYVTQMVNAHRQAILDFEKTAKETKDADIRAFATKTLPTLKTHLTRIGESSARCADLKERGMEIARRYCGLGLAI